MMINSARFLYEGSDEKHFLNQAKSGRFVSGTVCLRAFTSLVGETLRGTRDRTGEVGGDHREPQKDRIHEMNECIFDTPTFLWMCPAAGAAPLETSLNMVGGSGTDDGELEFREEPETQCVQRAHGCFDHADTSLSFRIS